MLKVTINKLTVMAGILTIGVVSGCSTKPETTPEPASLIVVEAYNNQTAEADSTLPQPVQVRILDEDGEPYTEESLSINWTVLTGGGSVAPAASLTDASGIASTVWTLGSPVGIQTLMAHRAGLDSVTLTATASAHPVLEDSLVIGSASGAAGDTVDVDIRLRTADDEGGLQFTLSFNDSLTAVEIVPTARLDDLTVMDSTGQGPGALTVVVFGWPDPPVGTIPAGSDEIMTVRVAIAGGTSSGTYVLTVDVAKLTDTTGSGTVDIAAGNGAVIVP